MNLTQINQCDSVVIAVTQWKERIFKTKIELPYSSVWNWFNTLVKSIHMVIIWHMMGEINAGWNAHLFKTKKTGWFKFIHNYAITAWQMDFYQKSVKKKVKTRQPREKKTIWMAFKHISRRHISNWWNDATNWKISFDQLISVKCPIWNWNGKR